MGKAGVLNYSRLQDHMRKVMKAHDRAEAVELNTYAPESKDERIQNLM